MGKQNICDGCRKHNLKRRNGFCIVLVLEYKIHNCPCNKCLVKMTCVELCDKFIGYHLLYGKSLSDKYE